MRGAENLSFDGQRLAEHGLGAGVVALVEKDEPEVVPAAGDVRVIVAEQGATRVERLPEERLRRREVAPPPEQQRQRALAGGGFLVRVAEACARASPTPRGRAVRPVPEPPRLRKRDRARPASPRCPCARGRSRRRRIASASSSSGVASFTLPRSRRSTPRSLSACENAGVSSPLARPCATACSRSGVALSYAPRR